MSNGRPWAALYPPGVPANVNVDEYPHVIGFYDEACTKYQNQVAFHCMGKDLKYKELHKMSERMAAYLHARGLKPGDKIALMMPNILQYPIAFFGAIRAGLIVVNTNPLYTPREMKHQFNDSGAVAIILAENFAHHLEKIITETQIRVIITTSIGELLGSLKGRLVDFAVKHIKRIVPEYHLPEAISFSLALRHGKDYKLPDYQADADDVLLLQYTGGTTGVSKGAMLTHRNIITNQQQIKVVLKTRLPEEGGVALCPLPLYHIFALTVNVLGLMSLGVKNILVTNPRDIHSVVQTLKAHPVHLFPGVNTLFQALLNNEKFRTLDFSKLKITVAGAMALHRKVAMDWLAVTGCHIAEGYGLTETSPAACVNPLDGSGKLGTVGLPLPNTDVRIVDESGNDVGYGNEGEIEIKGPQVMKGYYNRPDETQLVMHGDWFRTGDMGVLESDGYLRIVDRKKDMILVSGFNVYPNEIEDVISMHPKVLEVAVIGIPDEKCGEAVKAFIVPRDSSLTRNEVMDWCRENLTNYKLPKHVEFRESLPKTPVGKVLRRELRNPAG